VGLFRMGLVSSQPVFVAVFSESSDTVLLELLVETGMLICPPVGQNAHIEASVSARGGISKAQATCSMIMFGVTSRTEQITLRM
jgi:hypothetical protein